MDITMAHILKRFADGDTFSLSYALPIKSIPTEDKKALLRDAVNEEKKYLSERYRFYFEKEDIGIDFETLFDDILKECEIFCGSLRGKDLIKLCKSGNSPFLCDHVGKDTKYRKPRNLIWHFYHNIQEVLMQNERLADMPETDGFQADFLCKEEYSAFQKNFIRYEYTYSSHCTKGPLQLVLYFRLNPETENRLLAWKDDFDLAGSDFQDLAIYQDGRLVFSSCTHEGFNSLDSADMGSSSLQNSEHR